MSYINLDTGVMADNFRGVIREFIIDVTYYHFVSFHWIKMAKYLM